MLFAPISKLHSIIAVANLLAHNKFVTALKFYYRVLQFTAIFSDSLTPLRVTFILPAMVSGFYTKKGNFTYQISVLFPLKILIATLNFFLPLIF